MAIVYGLKVNLSVAMVGMLNHTALSLEGGHGHDAMSHSNLSVVTAELDDCGDTGSSNSSAAPEVKQNNKVDVLFTNYIIFRTVHLRGLSHCKVLYCLHIFGVTLLRNFLVDVLQNFFQQSGSCSSL